MTSFADLFRRFIAAFEDPDARLGRERMPGRHRALHAPQSRVGGRLTGAERDGNAPAQSPPEPIGRRTGFPATIVTGVPRGVTESPSPRSRRPCRDHLEVRMVVRHRRRTRRAGLRDLL